VTGVVSASDELLTASLPDFPFASQWLDFAGLRLAYLDEGAGAPVVFVHGEPTWSFLWRRVLVPVRDAGFRCLALDLPGFGRSDKPTDVGWYTYDRHTAALDALLEHLDVRGATIVVHDWGGPVGLRAALAARERVAGLVILDTGLFTGRQHMSDAWGAFRDFVARTDDLPVGMLVRGGCHRDPGDAVIAGYELPFPGPAAKAGARAFPLLVPTAPDAPGAQAGRETLEALRGHPWPKLILWADSDPVLPLQTGRRLAAHLGSEIDHVIPGAGHFLQEDAGPEIGRRIASWLSSAGGR
jgi:haloalkane dehalogenase